MIGRTLVWRLIQGCRQIDLVQVEGEVPSRVYVGLINGREVTRAHERSEAGVGLVRVAFDRCL